MMFTRLHISSFIALTIAAWLIALWVQGSPILSIDFLRPFGLVVGIVGGVAAVFSKWLWAWKIFQGWYVKRPDLRGTWKVKLQSNWVDPSSGEGVPPIECYLAVRQTLSSLSLRLMTPESRSKLIAHSIELDGDGIYQVAGIYRNEPKVELQGDRSEIHYGSLLLEVYGNPVETMDGHYWTDRGTRGSMTMNRRVRTVFDTYEAARAAFNPLSSSS